MKTTSLLRHISTILQTALLLGALTFLNIPAVAQADYDPFEYLDPNSIIDDGNYYYIQFEHQNDIHSYLSATENDESTKTTDFNPISKSLLWTLIRVDDNYFTLRSATGLYLAEFWDDDDGLTEYRGMDNENYDDWYYCFKFRISYSQDNYYNLSCEWDVDWGCAIAAGKDGEIWSKPDYADVADDRCRLRFVRPKPGVAYIIYRDDSHDNSNPNNINNRSYLTYSGTKTGSNPSLVSQRRSLFNINNSDWRRDAWRIPTVAAYHKDGLWQLEETSGGFLIKQYNTSNYVTASSSYLDLDVAANAAVFSIDEPGDYRYTKVKINNSSYMNYADGDGSNVVCNSDGNWLAGFIPVVVPADENQASALVKYDDKFIGVNGALGGRNLWLVEQDDASPWEYRLKRLDGQYFISGGGLTNDRTQAGTFSNFGSTPFRIERWYNSAYSMVIDKSQNEIRHKVSYLKSYARPTGSKQGLITNADSEWINSDGTQKVNEFKITHYVKKGETRHIILPTTWEGNNDHVYYQRWYIGDDEYDIESLQNYLSFDRGFFDDIYPFVLYKNGMVTGDEINWYGMDIPNYKSHVIDQVSYTNNTGIEKETIINADVSRYGDLSYMSNGDLVEPSLTMRCIYYMNDAKIMARALTACTGDNWLEEKTIHFPAKRISYESEKSDEFKGEFLALRHLFKDYWIFDDPNYATLYSDDELDDHLVSSVTGDQSGRIKIVIENNNAGITLGGHNNEGYYLFNRAFYGRRFGDSRFMAFKYPSSGEVTRPDPATPATAELKAYFEYERGGTTYRYQICKYTIVFETEIDSETKKWSMVRDTDRDPNMLREMAGKPIAQITFDYPQGVTYNIAPTGYTRHAGGRWTPPYQFSPSSPIPLSFEKTNYAFDGIGCNWGSYALVASMGTHPVSGYGKQVRPSNSNTQGYGIGHDPGLQDGFMYIDASEMPGDICSISFEGDFCAGDKLMCSGWISGANRMGDSYCPGSVTLTMKGEINGVTETIYRYCPGQCYEVDNGDYIDWQQFYFEFHTNKKYLKYWMEVNNNCVSSTGGDFVLDNIEVYAISPDVEVEMNTPLCIGKDDVEMQLLKLTIGFDKIVKATHTTEQTGASGAKLPISFVFLKKKTFLESFQTALRNLSPSVDKTIPELEEIIRSGEYEDLVNNEYRDAYKAAFDASVVGDITKVWDSDNPSVNKGAGVLNFHWYNNFSMMSPYSFANAMGNNPQTIYGETDPETHERFIVMNGNYPQLPWMVNTEYFIVPFDSHVTQEDIAGDPNYLYLAFNICSACCKKTEFDIKPPLQLLSMESSDVTQDLEVCEGKIPTVLTDLTGYNASGELVSMTDLNFDWWKGDPEHNLFATLENYHSQTNGSGVRLDVALSAFRTYYPAVTSLDGIVPKDLFTQAMLNYLLELVEAGQLVLHQKSISIPAEKASADEPYFYLVACPIHDGYFDQALNNSGEEVLYFCEEPQGLRMKITDKAPTLKCGFVQDENGFPQYDYPTTGEPLLSVRLAKVAQFETVKHGTKNEVPNDGASDTDLHFLWLPIRNAKVQTSESTKVIQRSDDCNVYLASSDDPTWDNAIYHEMKTYNVLPVVGKIVQLNAIDVDKNPGMAENDLNRLCIYFTENFEVREGYNYTLSLPFRETPGLNTCDGTLLINLKIVPDYEVWTGAAGNTDWNNDANWRRADGNTNPRLNGVDELYVGVATPNSPLYGYKSNEWNYRNDKDKVFRKGFAPLYCTHILLKSDEWGNAPVLYDAIDGNASGLASKPFPNLRDTSTPILKYDMQARLYDIWAETYGSASNKGRDGDLIAEMYQINTCDEIAFQPGTELLNAHLLNYNSAWMEYELDGRRWYLLGSPLQGTIAGEWYAPTGTSQQKTTYYDPVTFGTGYDRYSPAIYQRSWDKAKTVLYEVGSVYSTDDDNQTENLGFDWEGEWQNYVWRDPSGETDGAGADEYLDRLGYKPMGGNKANVAIKGIWSNTYNDATVDYATGGFSVMVMNHLKNNDSSNGKSIIRLPKEDTMYDYYLYSQTGSDDGGTDTNLSDVRSKDRAKNRGRLKTDLLLPLSAQRTEATASIYGDQRTYTRVPIKENELATMLSNVGNHVETVAAGASNLGYYLVENPFPCGLDMDAFFAANPGLLKKYWLLTATGQHLVARAESGDWISPEGADFAAANAVLAPGQGFFVQATTPGLATLVSFNKDMQAQSRFGKKSDTGTDYEVVVATEYDEGNDEINEVTDIVTIYNYEQDTGDGKEFPLKAPTRASEAAGPQGLVITAQRGGDKTNALVLLQDDASNDFLASEDTETFINSDLTHVPTVYTLCGRLATAVNSIHDFTCLPLGIESDSEAPCTLTFEGVEHLGDSVSFYDAKEKTLTALESGAKLTVSGQSQNRYYLVSSLSLRKAAEETHLQIFADGMTVSVISSTGEPLTEVSCFDTAGHLVHTASPKTSEYNFTLPVSGVFIIEARTDSDRKDKKVLIH